ncbi:MAG: transporter [Clostridiales bacterium]|nr:transporter [Clostridiales bacterium]
MSLYLKCKGKIIKGSILLFLLLILLYPQASFQGASNGLLLWFHTILPTLLPFIILSNLMIRLNITRQISRLFYPVFHKLFDVTTNGCYPILIGFLSGIPMGAKSTSDLLKDDKITLEEGQFLLTLCNNASPMFIISYIGISQLKMPHLRYPLLVILYSSAIIAAILYRKTRRLYINKFNKKINAQSLSTPLNSRDLSIRFDFDILDNSIMNGFEVITKIGGYIILFSILAQIVNKLYPLMGILKPVLMGLLEITTGINQICNSDIDIKVKIVLISVLTSFGGLSGMAQTKSVMGDTRLSINNYFIVKIINAIITLILSILYVTLFL